jgi:hypothetical protein
MNASRASLASASSVGAVGQGDERSSKGCVGTSFKARDTGAPDGQYEVQSEDVLAYLTCAFLILVLQFLLEMGK